MNGRSFGDASCGSFRSGIPSPTPIADPSESAGSPPKGQIVVSAEIVEIMKVRVTGLTDAALNDRFGISYNTWRKLIAGLPVRQSLAQRLTQRVRTIAEPSC